MRDTRLLTLYLAVCTLGGSAQGLRLKKDEVLASKGLRPRALAAVEVFRTTNPTWHRHITELLMESHIPARRAFPGCGREEASGGFVKKMLDSWHDDDHHDRTICYNPESKMQIKQSGKILRVLSFADDSRLGHPAAMITCQEDCRSSCLDTASTVGQCAGCPCTPIATEDSLYMYLRTPLGLIKEQGCRDSYNVLHVGLGTGAFLHVLDKVCSTAMVRVIEYDEEVIQAGRLFFGLDAAEVTLETLSDAPGKEVLQSDGEAGVRAMAQKLPGRFDAVVVDCMRYGDVPTGCWSEVFFSSIKTLLRPGGIVAEWTWPHQTDEIDAALESVQIGRPREARDGWVWARKDDDSSV